MKSASGSASERDRRAKYVQVRQASREAEQLLNISRELENFPLAVSSLARAFGLITSLAVHASGGKDGVAAPSRKGADDLCKLAGALPEQVALSEGEKASLRRLAAAADTLCRSPGHWSPAPTRWPAEVDGWAHTLHSWFGRIRRRLNGIYRAERRRSTLKRAAVILVGALLCGGAWAGISYLRDDGLRVTYYEGTEFAEPVHRSTETALNTDYGTAAPARGVPADGWSSRWEGYLVVPEDADYQFFSQSLDGLRLFIDGEPVIDNWTDHRYWKHSGAHGGRYLTAGRHRILVEHYDREGHAVLRVRWTGGPIPSNTIIQAPHIQKRSR